MCGRKYSPKGAALERDWHIGRQSDVYRKIGELLGNFDARPTEQLPVLRAGAAGGYELEALRWGLVPSWWKKSLKELPGTFNATAEKIAAKNAMWFGSFQQRRCLVPVHGFYEWHYLPDGKSVRHYIRLKDSEIFSLAGLWDTWKQPDGSTLSSYTVVTCPANPLMAQIHNKPNKSEGPRMPVIMTGETARAWFDPGSGLSQDDLLGLLKPYAQEAMLAYPVVNTAANPAELVVPIGDPVELPS